MILIQLETAGAGAKPRPRPPVTAEAIRGDVSAVEIAVEAPKTPEAPIRSQLHITL